MGGGVSGGHPSDEIRGGAFRRGETRDATVSIGLGKCGAGPLERREAYGVRVFLDLLPYSDGQLHSFMLYGRQESAAQSLA